MDRLLKEERQLRILEILQQNKRVTVPELSQRWGYPFALGLMLVSVIAPFVFFKRKGYL